MVTGEFNCKIVVHECCNETSSSLNLVQFNYGFQHVHGHMIMDIRGRYTEGEFHPERWLKASRSVLRDAPPLFLPSSLPLSWEGDWHLPGFLCNWALSLSLHTQDGAIIDVNEYASNPDYRDEENHEVKRGEEEGSRMIPFFFYWRTRERQINMYIYILNFVSFVIIIY